MKLEDCEVSKEPNREAYVRNGSDLRGSEVLLSFLEDGGWDRFEVYASAIASLRDPLDPRPGYTPCPDIPAICLRRNCSRAPSCGFSAEPRGFLNPPSNTRVFPLFTHASVRTLEGHLEFGGRNVVLLASRMRNIEGFTCVIPHDPSWSTISSALRNLQSLKELTISSGCLDLDNSHTLASLPPLCSVKTSRLPADTSATTKVFQSVPF